MWRRDGRMRSWWQVEGGGYSHSTIMSDEPSHIAPKHAVADAVLSYTNPQYSTVGHPNRLWWGWRLPPDWQEWRIPRWCMETDVAVRWSGAVSEVSSLFSQQFMGIVASVRPHRSKHPHALRPSTLALQNIFKKKMKVAASLHVCLWNGAEIFFVRQGRVDCKNIGKYLGCWPWWLKCGRTAVQSKPWLIRKISIWNDNV